MIINGATAALSIGSFTLSILAGYFLIPPRPMVPEPFMIVHSVEFDGKTIITDRTIEGFADGATSGIADWRVTVVRDGRDGPSCSTVAGPDLHQGWSRYSTDTPSPPPMHYDVWVGDPGCLARLKSEPGRYFEYVIWTPRDGSGPVSKQFERIIR